MSKLLVVKVSDLKPEMIEEIKKHLGDNWDGGMMDNTILELGTTPNGDSTRSFIEKLIASLTDENPDRPIKTRESALSIFKAMSEDGKKEVRKEGLEQGHDCYNCDDKSCTLHPDWVDLDSIQYDAKSH